MHPAAAAYSQGNALRALQRFEEALRSYERALELQADFAEAAFGRGVVLQHMQRLDEAVKAYDRALSLRPDFAQAHANRGAALQSQHRLTEALVSYDRALALKPDYTEVHFNRAVTLQGLQRPEEALQSYGRALAGRPEYIDAHYNRSLLLQQLRRFDEALESYARTLVLDSNLAPAYKNRGDLLRDLYRFEEALQDYDRALAIAPGYAEAWNSRGIVMRELDRFEEALQDYDRALAIAPGYAEAYSNRGVLHYALNRPQEALASFETAISIDPRYAQAHQNKAFAALLAGDLATGWAENEWRWQREGGPGGQAKRFDRAPWLGEHSLAGKAILLHAEQGLGDTLQFCRYASLVAEGGARVILEVPAVLASLLAGLEGVSQVISRGDPLPSFDQHCPLMSLPLAFGTTLGTVPARIPYLRSDPEKARSWREKLAQRSALKVGLVWSGANRPHQRTLTLRRNIPLAALESLRHPHIEFYSLQKGQPGESELARLRAESWRGPQLIDLTSELEDFSDTAALVENLDLVITVDTAVAHLAGALGKPVWLMLRFDTCWRWLLGRTDSPWYPTARLYRQQASGDWAGVVRAVRTDLFRLAGSRALGA